MDQDQTTTTGGHMSNLSEAVGCQKRGYFVFSKPNQPKQFYHFDSIAEAIKSNHPQCIGQHIFAQLDALGLSDIFSESETPITLPITFIK